MRDELSTDYRFLTWSERADLRVRYIAKQDGKCFHCGEFLGEDPPKRITDMEIDWDLFPPGFLNHPIHLQHSHWTGLTEGAVHAYCNAVMWQYEGR